VERGEQGGADRGAGARADPFSQPSSDEQIGDEQRHGQNLYGAAGFRRGQRQCMKRRHEQHPQRVRVPFDRPLANVPDETVAVDEVSGVAHRDHGIVAQGEIPLAVDDGRRTPEQREDVYRVRRNDEAEGEVAAILHSTTAEAPRPFRALVNTSAKSGDPRNHPA
jgi:hypothetical protein